ncbi:MAG TPA: hypothetical protein VK554_03340 [Bradyrhizobium sp.]|nr:hypothetical protein [Bradyrhizobium sp.]
MSDPKQQDLASIDHGPSGLREPGNDPVPLSVVRTANQGWPAQRKLDETVAYLRATAGRDSRTQKQPDIFAEAVAKVMQEQREPELFEAPSVLQNQALGIAARFAVATGVAALVALVFVVAFPSSQGPAGEGALSALPTWQSLTSSLFPAPQRKPAPTLVLRDGNGPVNEPLPLGVNVNSPGTGATVAIGGMPAGARLTVGRRMSAGEWRVPAQEISDASIIPPADFVGVMNLTAELRGSDGAALVSSLVRLTWTSATPVGTVATPVGTVEAPASAAAVAAGPAAAPTPPPQQSVTSPGPPPAAARAEPPMREINPDEVAGFLRRAQELLASGDVQAARLLLLRAAEAHDARAALSLARTFDPILSKQFGAADPEPDLAQARNWYQKAEEWGALEARRQLEALASYNR